MTSNEFLSVSHGCPKHTLERKFFEIEYQITLYRIAKGQWKIREVTQSQEPTVE